MGNSDVSLTRLYFGIFWDFVFWILVAQVVFVGALVVPVPSNRIRGAILDGVDRLWNASTHFRNFCVVLTVILALICAASMHAWATLDDLKMNNKNFCSLMEAERNVYMTAFSLFLNVMAIRLMQMGRQLHDARREIKLLTKDAPNVPKETKKDK